MNAKTLILIFCCLFYFNQTKAQKRNVYFFKNSDRLVKTRDSADYIRIVSEPDSGSVLYNITELYMNNKPKLIGKSSKLEYLRLEGQAVTYYPSGKKKEVATYKDGVKLGDDYEYYPNGKLYAHKRYLQNVKPGGSLMTRVSILDCLDSLGKPLVVDGNGYYIGYDNTFKNIYEEGNVKSGLKDGKWKGGHEFKENNLTFKEEYNNGELLAGEGIDENGKTYAYTAREMQPQFEGGVQGFSRYLAQNIKYPYNARMRKIQGMVVVSFVVEKDGSLTDVQVRHSPDDELSAEAVRVIRISPHWSPGTQYGKPVRVAYTVPVSFTLGRPY